MTRPTVAFVYKWTHIPTNMWYIGSRTKKGCNPLDGYLCSSKVVKPLIQKDPNNWVREIIKTGSPEQMIELEKVLLEQLDARNNSQSFNMHNGNGKFTTAGYTHSLETKQKISASSKGKSKIRTISGEKARVAGVRKAILGKPQTDDHKKKRSLAMSGKTQSEEHKAKRSAALKLYHAQKKLNNTNTGVF